MVDVERHCHRDTQMPAPSAPFRGGPGGGTLAATPQIPVRSLAHLPLTSRPTSRCADLRALNEKGPASLNPQFVFSFDIPPCVRPLA
jgi:hypothetical protein